MLMLLTENALQGYLYRGLRVEYYWFRMLDFATNFAIAAQTVLSASAPLSDVLILCGVGLRFQRWTSDLFGLCVVAFPFVYFICLVWQRSYFL